MKKVENNDVVNSIIKSKVQKSSNFKYKSFHTNFGKLYREKNFSLLIEEVVDNKNENDYDKDSFIKEYISFCEKESEINETNLN